jgi:hypothetical protein
MNVCKYVYVCVCTYICMYICMYVHIYVGWHEFMSICMCVYVCMYVCVCVCVSSLLCMLLLPVLSRMSLKHLVIIIGNGFRRRRSLYYLRNNVDVCIGGLRRTTTKSNSRYLLSRPVIEGGPPDCKYENLQQLKHNLVPCIVALHDSVCG